MWRPRPPTAAPLQTYTSPYPSSPTGPGGGVLLFGLDEDAGFKAVGVGNPRKLQEDLSGLAAQMEPALRPSFSVEEIEGGTVVAVEVPEVAYGQKPCYHRPHGIYERSYFTTWRNCLKISARRIRLNKI